MLVIVAVGRPSCRTASAPPWWGGEGIGLFGAAILGPMILTVALSLSAPIHARPPAEAILKGAARGAALEGP